jgi:nucleotidyltransferase substrate binding protein (TIGR01987 family)
MTDIKHYEFYYKLRTLPFVDEIWLFGSRAKGSQSERSDIDLAIVCPFATREEWQKIRDIVDSADTLLTIDCVRFDELQDDRLKNEIEKTKTVLIKKVKNSYPWYDIFLDLGEAIDKFKHVLAFDKNQFPYVIEASIKVFEYSYELYWKLLKKICHNEGIEVNSPRATFQQAYAMKLIDNEQAWLEMMENRNLTSHTYKQPVANAIYEHCKNYLPVMENDYINIKNKYIL